MEFTDQELLCTRCAEAFVFSAAEQFFFHEKLYINKPRLCKSCRSLRKGSKPRSVREAEVICGSCGAKTTVPFKPTNGKPCLCRPCFAAANSGHSLAQGEAHKVSNIA
jgi:CxxC-x17-CxxC domain-containing protein